MNPVEARLASTLARGWWLLLLRGIAAIAFGVLTWTQPEISLAALILLFAAYSMADGIFTLWVAFTGHRGHESWWLLVLEGLLGIGVGIMTFLAPGVTALAILFYIAIWSIATGVLRIVAAIRLRKEIEGEWLLVLSGIASVVFGVLLMVQPGAGAIAVLWLIAAYAIVFGVILVMLAFRLRGFADAARRSRVA
jgi:uncharacterized membrane protein HdeD (DUF308 family)